MISQVKQGRGIQCSFCITSHPVVIECCTLAEAVVHNNSNNNDN